MKFLNNLFKNKINLVLLSLLIFILYILYINQRNYFKEGLSDSIEDILCKNTSTTITITCGGDKPITGSYGTCEDTYGPDGSNETDKLNRCVNEAIPSVATPYSSHSSETNTKTCSQINHKNTVQQNKAVFSR